MGHGGVYTEYPVGEVTSIKDLQYVVSQSENTRKVFLRMRSECWTVENNFKAAKPPALPK